MAEENTGAGPAASIPQALHRLLRREDRALPSGARVREKGEAPQRLPLPPCSRRTSRNREGAPPPERQKSQAPPMRIILGGRMSLMLLKFDPDVPLALVTLLLLSTLNTSR